MRLTVTTVDGDVLEIEHLDDGSALELVADLQRGAYYGDGPFLVFDLDGGRTSYVARDHVVRVDLDPTPEPTTDQT